MAATRVQRLGWTIPLIAIVAFAQTTQPTTSPSTQPSDAMRGIEENALTGRTYISMHYANTPMLVVLHDFARQSHGPLGIHSQEIMNYAALHPVSIDLDHVEFWDALRVLEDQTVLSPDLSEVALSQNGPMHFIDPTRRAANLARAMPNNIQRDPIQLNATGQIRGAFFITPVYFKQNTGMFYDLPDKPWSNLSVEVLMAAEPKVRVLSFNTDNWLKECTDDKGNTLKPQFDAIGLPNQSRWACTMQAHFPLTSEIGRKLSIKGEVTCTIQTQSDLLDITDLSKLGNLNRTVSGVAVNVASLDNQANWEVLNLTAMGNIGKDHSELVNAIVGGMEMIDENGWSYESSSVKENLAGQQLSIRVSFDQPRVPTGGPRVVFKEFRWEVPTETKQVKVDFDLHDLELPQLQ